MPMEDTITGVVDTIVRYQTPDDFIVKLAALGLLFTFIFTFLYNKRDANDTNKDRGEKGEELQPYGKDFLAGGICNVIIGMVLAVYGPGWILGFVDQADAPFQVYALIAIAIGILWGLFGRKIFNTVVDVIRDKVKLAAFRGDDAASSDQSAATVTRKEE